MPGSPLNIPYPVLGEQISVALQKLVTALQTIQNDVEPKVLGSEIQWLADFSANGHALVDLSKVQLDDLASLVGLETGTLYFDLGDLWVQTASGAVRITIGGNLNAAALGGIVGDYGGANPARVTYVDGTDTYVFTGDTNDWSVIQCDDVALRNNGNWTTLSADAANSTAQSWTFSTQNASGVALLRQSNTGVVASSATVTADLPMSGSLVLSGGGQVKHGVKSRVTLASGRTFTNCADDSFRGILCSGAAGGILIPPPAESWMRITGFLINITKSSAASSSFSAFKIDNSASGSVSIGVSSTINTTTIGTSQVIVPLTTPTVFASDEHYWILFSNLVSSDRIASIGITWDNV